jgi:hypothetical protein
MALCLTLFTRLDQKIIFRISHLRFSLSAFANAGSALFYSVAYFLANIGFIHSFSYTWFLLCFCVQISCLPSIHFLSVSLLLFLYLCLSFCPSVICLSVSLSVFFSLSVFLSVSLYICVFLSVSLSLNGYVSLPFMSLCLSLWVFVCLSVCLSNFVFYLFVSLSFFLSPSRICLSFSVGMCISLSVFVSIFLSHSVSFGISFFPLCNHSVRAQVRNSWNNGAR